MFEKKSISYLLHNNIALDQKSPINIFESLHKEPENFSRAIKITHVGENQ